MTSVTPVNGPHTHTSNSVSLVMYKVIFALLPATIFGVYLFGWPALNILVITIVAALVSEALCLYIAGKPINSFLYDGSAILTGLLLAMTLPPWSPWWIGVIGSVFAIIVGKHVFGGIGQNIFNPAMLARVVLLVSFPLEMTTWINTYPLASSISPDFIQGLRITLFSEIPTDFVSGASVLGEIRTELSLGHTVNEIISKNPEHNNLLFGFMKGSLGETSAVLIFVGGLFLMLQRIISWHIPVAMLGSIALLATIFHLIDPQNYSTAWTHVLSGGAILGAFFIATDIVTSPNSILGKIIFGSGCGVLVYIIRTWGGYPEGVAFAVILMNATVPLIDYYIRPRIYGYKSKGVPLEYTEDKLSPVKKVDKK